MAPSLLLRVRRTWDRLAVYLPIVLMGVMAMATYWPVSYTHLRAHETG
jgi:hypothetical protein